MKKKVMLSLFLAGMCLPGYHADALELALRDGTILHNVRIQGLAPRLMQVAYTAPGKGDGYRQIRYSQLTPASRGMLSGYFRMLQENLYPRRQNPQQISTAGNPSPYAFTPGFVNLPPSQYFTLNAADVPDPETYAPVESVPDDFNMSNAAENIVLPGTPRQILLHSVVILTGGTLGYADSESFFGSTPTHFGEIYVYGVFMPQGNIWTGTVYPTAKMILHRGNYYPCYATSVEMARKIDSSIQY